VSADPPNSTPTLAGQPFWTANDGNARDAEALDPGNWVTVDEVRDGFCDEAMPQSTWHGSHVTGLAAASGNNGRSGLGVAFDAKFLPVRVLGRCGGYVSDVLAGARWAAGLSVPGVPPNATPARILNLSLGFSATCDATTQSVIDEVRARNVSVVASAGNDSSTLISVPANCRGVFAVTAHTREGDSADYANVGSGVRISAAGGGLNTLLAERAGSPRGIVSTGNAGFTVPTSDADVELSGTSMAAPQVAGVLALLLSVRPDLPMSTLESIVVGSARPFPTGGYCATNPQSLPAGFCGSGLLDANAAVMSALGIAPSASGGGGCTTSPNGQADLSLVLLALAAAGLMVWRRRQVR
jgi:serine protease